MQARLSTTGATLSATPSSPMLTGRIECPLRPPRRRRRQHRQESVPMLAEHAEPVPAGRFRLPAATYSLPRTEASVIRSLQNAAERPEVVAAAMQAYQEQLTTAAKADTAAALRLERAALDAA